jgi:cytoskeletal protein CcmA (bactofilin family)
MAEDKTSILLSDLSIEGDLVEKDKIIIDAKISGDIKANEVETHKKSKIKGNITSKVAKIGGQIKGNIASDKTIIKNSADVDGVLNQKTLSIEEGAKLKIKTETNN